MSGLSLLLNVLDIIVGILVAVEGFWLFFYLTFNTFILGFYIIVIGACVLMLELVDIPSCRVWFPFYFHHIGRAITFIILVSICYTGTTFSLALFIVGCCAAAIWIAMPLMGMSHDMGPMNRPGGGGSYEPVASPNHGGQYQEPPRPSQPPEPSSTA
eukprot:TRINITY_DN4865_c0_g1_i5.p1 TRINITY_DN4865_c0_g1~~TRINITY_DN4865_c0_g1_i5.p1  ORF type:complete len:157 (-),score=23.27 TRINITY_DN4865_c0_g1_i5:44-514(-)